MRKRVEKCARCGCRGFRASDRLIAFTKVLNHRVIDVMSPSLDEMFRIGRGLRLELEAIDADDGTLGDEIDAGVADAKKCTIESDAFDLLNAIAAKTTGTELCWHLAKNCEVYSVCVDGRANEIVSDVLDRVSNVFEALELIEQEAQRRQRSRRALAGLATVSRSSPPT